MGVIHVLDKHTANLIAAGEVVERPASAIKEMMENCADAGASAVTVEIKDGGISFIRVTDNGYGMAREDVPQTVLRHATSKIRTGADLEAIGTLGFRGEALAAIAAVSRLRILTKRREDAVGTVFSCAFGDAEMPDDAGCPDGTTVIVENLFENTPARLKFLKKNTTEATAVAAVCEKFALSRPDIAVTFLSDGNVKLRTPGDGNLKNAVYASLGKEFASALLSVGYEYAGLSVSGFVGKPECCRPNRNMQNFFVNGRYIKSRTMTAALEEGFRAFCPTGKFPACVLFLSLNLKLVDVNIHPAKLEVKFSDERQVFDAIFFAVKNALSRGIRDREKPLSEPEEPFMPAPATPAAPVTPIAPVAPVPHASAVSRPDAPVFETPEIKPSLKITENVPLAVHHAVPASQSPAPVVSPDAGNAPPPPPPQEKLPDTDVPPPSAPDVPSLKVNPFDPPVVRVAVEKQQAILGAGDLIETRYVGEIFHTYLLVERADRFYLIDKHAAHERILYERIKHAADNNDSQYLLEPVPVHLTPPEFHAASVFGDYFRGIGFDCEEFGGDTYLIRSLPSSLDPADVADVFTFLAGKLAEGNTRSAGEIFDRALFTAACKAATKAGNRFTDADNERIIHEIFDNDAVLYCPHGRPVLIEYTKERIEKLFGRT